MIIEFLEPALWEYIEAIEYYAARGEGLELDFSEEVQRTIRRIIEYPEAWSLVSKRTRRCRTKRFPYGIIYQIRGDMLLVIAVMHLHREPQSWKTRIANSQQ